MLCIGVMQKKFQSTDKGVRMCVTRNACETVKTPAGWMRGDVCELYTSPLV
eukprot:m.120005 g.120005  ORF g.120005 m.120005 type:complete len:51 (+) comp28780_c0_seq1:221-373(+)